MPRARRAREPDPNLGGVRILCSVDFHRGDLRAMEPDPNSGGVWILVLWTFHREPVEPDSVDLGNGMVSRLALSVVLGGKGSVPVPLLLFLLGGMNKGERLVDKDPRLLTE